MLNKEFIFAIPKAGKNYTHILVTYFDRDNFRMGFLRGRGGSISPATLELPSFGTVDIDQLYQDMDYLTMTLYVDSFVDSATPIFLGRYDTKRYIGESSEILETSGYVKWKAGLGFSLSDGGKEIPIWLATTPPGHKTSQEHLTEESVDAQQGITNDGECGKIYNCHGKLLRKTLDGFKVRNFEQSHTRGILQRRCSTARCDYNISSSPIKRNTRSMDKCRGDDSSSHRTFRYSLRARGCKPSRRIYKRSRLYYRHTYSSVVIVKEARYD